MAQGARSPTFPRDADRMAAWQSASEVRLPRASFSGVVLGRHPGFDGNQHCADDRRQSARTVRFASHALFVRAWAFRRCISETAQPQGAEHCPSRRPGVLFRRPSEPSGLARAMVFAPYPPISPTRIRFTEIAKSAISTRRKNTRSGMIRVILYPSQAPNTATGARTATTPASPRSMRPSAT